MKINLDFYDTANTVLKTCIEGLEEDLEKFKEICDAVLSENKFGTRTEIVLRTLSNNIYEFSSEKLSTSLADVISIVEGYVAEMDEEDVL